MRIIRIRTARLGRQIWLNRMTAKGQWPSYFLENPGRQFGAYLAFDSSVHDRLRTASSGRLAVGKSLARDVKLMALSVSRAVVRVLSLALR